MEFLTIGGLAHELGMTVPAVRHLVKKSGIIEDRRLNVGGLNYRIFFDEDLFKLRKYLKNERKEKAE